MRCSICERTYEEVTLYKGITPDGLIDICSSCAKVEDIPIIKKPTYEQVKDGDSFQSVRERMERLSGYGRRNSNIEQIQIERTLSKLRSPMKKQYHPDVVDNYSWEVLIARRRKKITINQLSNMLNIPLKDLEGIEKGLLPANFREIFQKLESFFGIKLLKQHDAEINFRRDPDYEKRILDEVRLKMGKEKKSRFSFSSGDQEVEEKKEPEVKDEDFIEVKKKDLKAEKMSKISKGELDFSKRKNLQDVTLNDLIDLKRKKEQEEKARREKMKEESMIGDEIDFVDEDELDKL